MLGFCTIKAKKGQNYNVGTVFIGFFFTGSVSGSRKKIWIQSDPDSQHCFFYWNTCNGDVALAWLLPLLGLAVDDHGQQVSLQAVQQLRLVLRRLNDEQRGVPVLQASQTGTESGQYETWRASTATVEQKKKTTGM